MQQQFTNFKEFFQSIQILHAALLGGVIMMLVVIKFVLGVEESAKGNYLFAIVGIGLAMSSLVFGNLIYNKKIEAIKKEQPPLMERLIEYRSAFIINLALLEGPALVCLILHFLNGDPLLFYACIFMVIMLALARPSKEKIMRELGLRSEDIQ